MSLIIDRVEQEVVALEASVELLLSVQTQLKDKSLTLSVALEADRLVNVQSGSFTKFHFDNSQDCRVALEEAEEGVWAVIKAFFAKIGDWIHKLLAWLGLANDKPKDDTVEEAKKATDDAASTAVELVKLVEQGESEHVKNPEPEKKEAVPASSDEPKADKPEEATASPAPAPAPQEHEKPEAAPEAPPHSIAELIEKYASHLDIKSHLAAALITKDGSNEFMTSVEALAKEVNTSMDVVITDVEAYEKDFQRDLARAKKIGLSHLDVEKASIPEGAVKQIQEALKQFQIGTHPEEKAEYAPEKLANIADAVKILAGAHYVVFKKLGSLDPARKVKELEGMLEVIKREILNSQSSVGSSDEQSRAAQVCRVYMNQTRAALTYFSQAARAYHSITSLMRELKTAERQLKQFFIQVVEQAAGSKIRMGAKSAEFKEMVGKWKRSLQLDTMVLSNK